MDSHRLSAKQVCTYEREGYLVLPSLFSAQEIDDLHQHARSDPKLETQSVQHADASGKSSRLWITDELNEDLYSSFATSPQVIAPVTQLLGETPLHFHHKVMQKQPRTGGAWEWHQDYGYWYALEQFPYPSLISCYIAIDKATRENGCLQLLAGSHLAGRIDHGLTGEQHGADMTRVAALQQKLPLIYGELNPGDVLLFHSNTLHRSDDNISNNPRWSLICCYTAASNLPLREDNPPRLTPIPAMNDIYPS
ncbi:phytanoyl-CoA dioxygenase family protein [Poriferisphaera sp. WC338]|uniref:phytanoyl-CoA dioxygenase family protein n=1 Tax=Poriferisphaera sp. WC338 TaxID=3425129 RepID=UPI003D81A2EA